MTTNPCLSFNMSLCKYLHTFTDNRHNKTDNFNFTIENFKHFSYKSSLKKTSLAKNTT